jgi:micrococcal nuclease
MDRKSTESSRKIWGGRASEEFNAQELGNVTVEAFRADYGVRSEDYPQTYPQNLCTAHWAHFLSFVAFPTLMRMRGYGIRFYRPTVGVIDGDSIRVMHDGKAEQVRLNGIDCPEKKQPFGTRAKQFTSAQSFAKEVTVRQSGRDRYGRTLAEVILPDGRSLNRELLKAGLAWWFRKYSKDVSLGDLEDEARLTKRGLWADSDPVPPWEWRKRTVGAR